VIVFFFLPFKTYSQDIFLFYRRVQTGSDALPFRSAFRDVIFRQSWDSSINTTTGVSRINLEPEGKILQILCLAYCLGLI